MKDRVPGTEIAMRIVMAAAGLFIFGYCAVALLGHVGKEPGAGANSGPAVSSLNLRTWLQSYAADSLAAHAYNRAMADVDHGDTAGFNREFDFLTKLNRQDLIQSQTSEVADALVRHGQNLYALSDQATGVLRRGLLEESEFDFRRALQIDPGYSSSDPELLNSLGYFLADQGKNASDYRTAENLLRRAVSLRTDEMASASGIQHSALGYERAVEPCDSLAWALFKEGKLPESRKVEEGAFKDIDQYGPLVAAPAVDPSVVFHLAEIYRASGLTPQARSRYQQAMNLHPGADLTTAIQAGLRGLRPASSANAASSVKTPAKVGSAA